MDNTIIQFSKNLLTECDCREDCYRGAEIEEIEGDLKRYLLDNPEIRFPYSNHEIAVALRQIGDAVPVPPPPKYGMVFDGGSFVDSIKFNSFEAAKEDALDTLTMWMVDCLGEHKMPTEIEKWTEKQRTEWDSMIFDCSVCVRKYNLETKEYDIEFWHPSKKDEESIGWVEYSELLKSKTLHQ